jgi:hypothetical protein
LVELVFGVLFIFFFLVVWTQGLTLLGPHYTTRATPPALLHIGYFRDRSLQLFPQAGFELWSSWVSASQVTRITGVSHWCPASVWFFPSFCPLLSGLPN